VRFGMIHRNTFLNAPSHLDPLLRLRRRSDLRVAGQLTGVEGYVESAATGLLAARTLAAELAGGSPQPPPPRPPAAASCATSPSAARTAFSPPTSAGA